MKFEQVTLENTDYWRSIILFGKNVASYKFALAKTLLELKPESGQLLKLSDIAPLYSNNISEHLKLADRQGTSPSSKFLDDCRKYNIGKIDQNELVESTLRYGFVNVIDAFHIVGSTEIPIRFYIDERKDNNGIRITDEFSELILTDQSKVLPHETESRWRLVETAWDLGISRSLLSIHHNEEDDKLIALMTNNRRKTVTGSREALNGYQKGRCFYCGTNITAKEDGINNVDVDHFFPHVLKENVLGTNVDGIWNLVLACSNCNRGTQGKFDKIPTLKYLKKLYRRNEYLINSHHPLRETLIGQTGRTANNRAKFLNNSYNKAIVALIHTWEPSSRLI